MVEETKEVRFGRVAEAVVAQLLRSLTLDARERTALLDRAAACDTRGP